MTLLDTAANFKPNVNRITELRIKLALQYVIYCYHRLVVDKRKYHFSERGHLKHEDFLRNGLVDDYLSKKELKRHYKLNISDAPNVEIYFQKEENHTYTLNGKLSDDYIDITIKETKLSELLSTKTENEIYFAIECKRIRSQSDYSEYIKDIKKFADRPYNAFRLPYEGQIAFIENSNLKSIDVANSINERLEINTTIRTVHSLNTIVLNEMFDGSYYSTHRRNYGDKIDFTIYHLLLDYSNVIVN